ncbi:hypothetical protein Misp01_07430 [Microtetraspora sp. NBRC 13810]|uniref:DUF1707 SHOCT-like domain-containing protein n=1 Tax=Microtetraspora sp. NBRC 13810 TaxID=3030990 RepID=UPI0024A459D9|nr:DUF1707 domain-containing protein [Microtetraspora sp. NBRC 13810]GLW05613.1 hypothetical protein Misp01_07430 [Microtetraspora sp. NBRC 13810]
MRASDGDRERVAAELREHCADGRLTIDEFHERLDQVFRSKTHAELQLLTADLPATDLRAVAERAQTAAEVEKKPARNELRDGWRTWAFASGINWMIWVAASLNSDGFVYPWPFWVMIPWGLVLLVMVGKSRGSKG